MKPTQGVILIMIAALLLYLTWSSRSALRNASGSGTGTSSDTGSAPIPGVTEDFSGIKGLGRSIGQSITGRSGQGAGSPDGAFTHTTNGIIGSVGPAGPQGPQKTTADKAFIGGEWFWAGGPWSGKKVSESPANAGDLTPYLV